MRKYILFIGSCLLCLLLFCLWYFNTNVMFQRKFHFKLPKTVEIVNQSYSFYYDTLEMKVSFCMNDYQKITEGINNFAEDKVHEVEIKSEKQMFTIQTFCKFWEEEKEEAVLAYKGYIQGRWRLKTRIISILITKDKENEGQYFLHVWY